MEKLAKHVLICSLLTALVLISCPVILSSEVEDESEFNYDIKSEIGPFNWGDIKPEWSRCKNGSMQSPIDLLNERVQIVSHLGTLEMNYQPSNATIKNRGHDIKLAWLEGTSYLQINGTQYVLKQFHWHSPSEHTIDGKRLDLELHMVHETPSGQTAVIGIFYKTGRPDPFLSLMRSVSREQIRLLREAVHDDSETNARPLQPTNNRLVQYNKPKDQHPHTLQFPSRLLTQSRDLIESHQQRHRHRHHHSHLLWPFASPFTSPPFDVSSSDSLSV
ncbi:hypothetical protein Fmac_022011 [Flemingia macrophylla]|uniref:Alpha-carbonic anhydrase domain-containing protein n=1 Tax=Flemingia macrophylla TaxID=520843 RepID=A0ABD1LYK4_9FABA